MVTYYVFHHELRLGDFVQRAGIMKRRNFPSLSSAQGCNRDLSQGMGAGSLRDDITGILISSACKIVL